MELKEKYEDYTEHEFLEFIRNICEVNTDSQSLHSSWVRHFTKITEHPSGSDLIYYPEDGADDSPEGILELVKNGELKMVSPVSKINKIYNPNRLLVVLLIFICIKITIHS